MRDHVLLYVNGRRFEVRGEDAFISLSDFLRNELRLTGTKVVCAEGDCGACTVLVGRTEGTQLCYETVDACIAFVYHLDCKHVITVEGLRPKRVGLHPVQQAMIDSHGSQCGFCTPGFVMALTGLFEQDTRVEEESLRTALTGNLCRCTGYLPILNAGLALDPTIIPAIAEIYPDWEMVSELHGRASETILIQTEGCDPEKGRAFFAPRTLQEAIDFKDPENVIVAGGTELGVLRNKKGLDPPTLLSLMNVTELGTLTRTDQGVEIGANVTWTRIEQFAKESLPEFHKIIVRFGSPQIRNVSTLVGNVANGSPIADSLPFLFVMDAEIELISRSCGCRRVRISDFYKGYKLKDLQPDEIITRVHLPLPGADDLLKLYKVSRRNDLDIATFGAAIRVERQGETITSASVAFSGVAPMVVRLPRTEAFLAGKRIEEETFREAGRIAGREIQPISDVRGSRDYRLLLGEKIMLKFYRDCTEANALP